MKKQQKNQPTKRAFDSYSKLLVSDWPVLRKIVAYFSQAHLKKMTATFTDQQLSDALEGPASEFVDKMFKAYGHLSQMRFEVNLKEDITFLEAHPSTSNDKKKKLSAQEKILKDLKMNDVRKVHQDLEALSEQLLQQWQNAQKHWAQQIEKQLIAVDFALTAHELAALKDNDSLSALFNRYQDLSITPPKTETPGACFRDYFYLKAYLAVQSHLSMNHEAHAAENILPVLKTIDSVFSQIHKEENFLQQTQQKQIDAVLKPINP